MLRLRQKSKVRRQKLLKLFSNFPFNPLFDEAMHVKLPVVSGEDTIKALYKAGFRVVRQKGSHVRMEKKTEKGTVKVTIPLHSSLKKGTLRVILKQAELSVEEFVRLLQS